MKRILYLVVFLAYCSAVFAQADSVRNDWSKLDKDAKLCWRAVHLLHYNNDAALDELSKQIPKLSEMGINKIILEVDYHFEFKSHPELRQTDTTITAEGAARFVKLCRENGIDVIPQFQCVGHQSWAKDTWKLLTVYPEFDLTPGAFPENEGIYCREWDVTNPKVNEVVFALMGEIIDAFDSKAMHVGMDEVFLLGSEHSPSTKGKNPAELYAKAVNDIYDFLVNEKEVEMLMWGDRLIDTAVVNYGVWESAANGTADAIDNIPKDIIICDWHYESYDAYEFLGKEDFPSIPLFIEKGFRVLPCSWRVVENMENLMYKSLIHYDKKMLGHLFTLWSSAKGEELINYKPMVEGLKLGKPYFK